jgi:SPP1 family predicted phage head-tail adaptor
MSNVAAGRLRHRLRVERQVNTKNSVGETSTVWQTVATYWCEIRPLSSRELLASEQVQSEVDTVIVMRYNTTVKASMRGVHVENGADGTIYNLKAPIRDPESGRDWISIPATSLLNAG